MKKLIYLILVIGLVFTACDPMDEIHTAIDTEENAIVGNVVITLTDADYTDEEKDGGFLELDDTNFSSEDEAKSLIPNYLTGTYPVWGKGSSALVTYNLVANLTDIGEVNDFINADNYTLVADDYIASGSDVLGFYPAEYPSDYLDNILADNIVEAEAGAIVKVKYIQYTEEPIITTTTNFSFEENFDYGAVSGNLTTITTEWTGHSGSDPYVGYDASSNLAMTDYPNSDIGGSVTIGNPGGEDVNSEFTSIDSGIVYASTLVNFSAVSTGDYFFHFREAGGSFRARVGAKDDGFGKILFGIGASSSTLTYGSTAFDLDTTYLLVASYDIDNGVSNLYVLTTVEATEPATPEATNTGNADGVVSIAIRQDWSDGPTGTLDGIRVATSWEGIMVNDIAIDVQGEKTYSEVYYGYDGSEWNESDGVYYLSSDDYDSMGTASGQPGKYNNFQSSVAPSNYIPAFLALAHPFAQEEDELIVMYKFRYNSQTNIKGNLYTVVDGVWTAHNSSLQFGHDGNTWVPDNTIKYTLVTADYTFIASEFTGVDGFVDAAANLTEHGNFKTYEGVDGWNDEMLVTAMGALADKLNPSASIGQQYVFTFSTFGPSRSKDISIIKTNDGWVLND